MYIRGGLRKTIKNDREYCDKSENNDAKDWLRK